MIGLVTAANCEQWCGGKTLLEGHYIETPNLNKNRTSTGADSEYSS